MNNNRRELIQTDIENARFNAGELEDHSGHVQVSCTKAIVHALLDIADAIREQKAEHTIHVTQDLDAEAVARSIRAHLDGEAE